MKRPAKDVKRDVLYLVKPGRGDWFGTAGGYVGETATHVVLRIGEAVKGFAWEDVDPVAMHETSAD
jgi:hypothetical protein